MFSPDIIKKHGSLLSATLIVILVLIAYSNSFTSPFQYDDSHQIVKNQNIRSLVNIPAFFTNVKMGSYQKENNGYRPLTYASFAVSYAISGYNVWSWHLLNIMLHCLNSFFVFLIIQAILKKKEKEGPFPPALVASLVFALHPIQTGAVTYISGRAALLASFFALAALYCFVRFREGGEESHIFGALSPVLFLMGLLSKETASAFIGLALLYDMVFTFNKKTLRSAVYLLTFLAALVLYLFLRKYLGGFFTVEETIHTKGAYLRSEAAVLLLYIRLMIFPFNQNADFYLPEMQNSDPRVWAGVIFIGVATALFFRLRRPRPEAAFFGGWFMLALLPESSFFPITDLAVEYRLYLPSVGIISFALILLNDIPTRVFSLRRTVAVVAVALILLTINRNYVWSDTYTLWSDVARKSPSSPRAHSNLGSALFEQKNYLEAINELKLSLELDPNYPQRYFVHDKLGLCYYEMEMIDEAIREFRQTIRLAPRLRDGYCNLGAALMAKGQIEEASAALKKAVEIDPGYGLAHFNLARVFVMSDRKDAALKELELAVKYAPEDFESRFALAGISIDLGMPGEGVVHAGKAVLLAKNGRQKKAADELLAHARAAKDKPDNRK